jgi:hypothetical protein
MVVVELVVMTTLTKSTTGFLLNIQSQDYEAHDPRDYAADERRVQTNGVKNGKRESNALVKPELTCQRARTENREEISRRSAAYMTVNQ